MYYVIYHMMEFMRLNNTFKRGTDVTAWGSNLLKLKEDVLKKEFKCIQVSLARIINKDVYSPAGVFHGGFDETPAEVEDRLRKQFFQHVRQHSVHAKVVMVSVVLLVN